VPSRSNMMSFTNRRFFMWKSITQNALDTPWI
jgi:hypothetical protein